MEHLKKIILLIFLLLPLSVFAGDVTLEWDPNTELYLSGYKIHWSLDSGQYDNSIDVGKVTQATIIDVVPGQTTYFAATAYSLRADWMSYCVSDAGWIESYPDAAERQTACTDNFNSHSDNTDVMESGFSNEVSFDGPVVIMKSSRPGKLKIKQLE